MIAALFLWLASPAAAGQYCNDDRNFVVQALKQKFQETPTWQGVSITGGLVEIFTSQNGETWTLVVTVPNGMTCMIGAGSGWREVPYAEPDEPT